MIPAMLGWAGIFNSSKLAGKEQPPPQNLARFSAAPGSCCKLCFCFPEAEQKLGWKALQHISGGLGAAAAHPSCSQLLAQQRGWLNTTCGHPCVKAGTGDRQQKASQGSSALSWGSCAEESSISLQGQCLGCFLLPQQRKKPTTWTKVQGFSP